MLERLHVGLGIVMPDSNAETVKLNVLETEGYIANCPVTLLRRRILKAELPFLSFHYGPRMPL